MEFDLLIDSESNVQNAVNVLEGQLCTLLSLGKLDVEGPPIENTQAIKLGIQLLNEERYWEGHEALDPKKRSFRL